MSNKFYIKPPGKVLEHPFPLTRPDIKIVESADPIYEVDCQELQWWFAIPKMGETYMWADYDGETQQLDAITQMIPTAPAMINNIECVEIQFNEWLAKEWPTSPDLMYVAMDDTHTRWISVVTTIDGMRIYNTIGDDWFEDQWGPESERRIFDDGRYELQPDGSYKTTDGKGLGAGTYDVTIGENTFHCLRIIDPDLDAEHGGEMCEVYIEEGGRTVFFRRYDGRFLRGHDLIQKFPNNRRIIIDDTVYVHSNCTGWFHDTFTLTSLGKTNITNNGNP